MKKLVILIFGVFAFMTVQAQWSIGIDGRFASWKEYDERDNYGVDIVLNYKLPVGQFFLMPSVGYFYQKFKNHGIWVDGPHKKLVNEGYRLGVDLTCAFGKSFGLGKGYASIFTGPRYAYAFASHPEYKLYHPYLQNSFDWRVGISYDISKITISAKCDIAFLKLYKSCEVVLNKNEKQLSTLAVGVAYNF